MVKNLELSKERNQYEDCCKAWINNKVTALIWSIESGRPKDSILLLKHEFFLDELQHHFIDGHAANRIWRAFRYLKIYLRNYPSFNSKHKAEALRQLALIYSELSMNNGKSIAEKK